ncbi:hypothetical protein IFM89_008992 [Coptis chinensis]|uniref:Reverse transcriptase zinc-binding domain-containing protein n=1 Tax=Coptis chinensis TaxID=261450 RepID=A0A835LZ14_9MAGN|nr:hypothetical protein IFM89_008992 [Coptis chinensis]
MEMLMKLAWSFRYGSDAFSSFMRLKFLTKEGSLINYYKPSSVWPGVKKALQEIDTKCQWVIGNGAKIDLWRDCWAGKHSIQKGLNLLDHALKGCTLKLESLIQGPILRCPAHITQLLHLARLSLHDVKKSTDEDYLVWWPDIKGHFSAQDGNSKKMGVTIASKCRHCGAQEESLIHLIWECVFAKEMWNWLAGKFKFRGTFTNMKEAIKLSKNSSPRVVHLWTAAVFRGMTGLWKHRNKIFFQDKAVSKAFC